jgi:Zn-dependent protease with chaperone function
MEAYTHLGGQVVVYTGLLDVMDDDDMLAAILGHEIGHYIARAFPCICH